MTFFKEAQKVNYHLIKSERPGMMPPEKYLTAIVASAPFIKKDPVKGKSLKKYNQFQG